MAVYIYNAPIGPIRLVAENGFITGLYFGTDTREWTYFDAKEEPALLAGSSDTEIIGLCTQELDAYFAGQLREFTVPIKADGTEFRVKVWQALLDIPYGATISYKELAHNIGQPTAVRAVGGANHHNPISIIIPCHRVIGAGGSLTGYGGGLAIKEQLLALEARYSTAG